MFSQNQSLNGADITYLYKGNNVYEINVNVYKDCASIFNLPARTTVFYVSSSCGISGNVLLNAYSSVVLPFCPSAWHQCNGGTVRAIEKRSYKGTVQLQAACNDYKFQWRGSNRSNKLNTMMDGVYQLYVEALLNTADAPGNSSVQFTNEPLSFAVKDKEMVYIPGGEDLNNDVVVYEQVQPMISSIAFLGYESPFSLLQPLRATSSILIGPTNGSLVFTPTETDSTFITMRAVEYRNNKVIGSAMRDMRIEVGISQAPQPTLSGINGSQNVKLSTPLCNRTEVAFTVLGFSTTNFPLQLKLLSPIEGATLTQVSGLTKTVSGIFRFRPTKSGKFSFALGVFDANCPIQGQDVKTFEITVLGVPQMKYNVGKITYWPDCNTTLNTTVTSTVTGGAPPYQNEWYASEIAGKISSTTVAAINTPGYYYHKVTDQFGCTNTDTLSFITDLRVYYTYVSDSVCKGTKVKFINWTSIRDNLTNIKVQSMDFADGSPIVTYPGPNIRNFEHVFDSVGIFNVRIQIIAENGCTQSFSSRVRVYDYPKAMISILGFACERPGQTKVLSISTINGASYDEMNHYISYTDNTPTLGNLRVILTDAEKITITLTSAMRACSNTTTQEIKINPKPIFLRKPEDFAPRCNQISDGDTLLSVWGKSGNTFTGSLSRVLYKWTGSTNFITDSTYNYPIRSQKGDVKLNIFIKDTLQCINEASVTIIDSLDAKFFLPANYCKENATIAAQDFTLARTPLNYYYWDFDNGQKCIGINATCTGVGGVFYPTFAGVNPEKKRFKTTLIVEDRWGCKDTSERFINLYLIDTTAFAVLKNGIVPDEICYGDKLVLNSVRPIDDTLNNINYWIWDYGDGSKADTVVRPRSFQIAGVVNQRDFSYAPDTVYNQIQFNQTHVYTTPGIKTIRHIVGFNKGNDLDRNGKEIPFRSINDPNYTNACIMTFSKNVNVFPKLEYKLDTNLNKCAGTNTQFLAKRISGIFSVAPSNFVWKFYQLRLDTLLRRKVMLLHSLTGENGDTTATTHIFRSHGSKLPWYGSIDPYIATLKVTDSKGCSYTDSILFDNIRIQNTEISSQGLRCQNHPIIFDLVDYSSISSDSIAHVWRFGDDTPPVISGRTVSHKYKPSRQNSYQVIVQIFGRSDYGYSKCYTYDTLVYQNSYAPTAAFNLNKNTLCLGDTLFVQPKVLANGDPDSLNILYRWKSSENALSDTVTKNPWYAAFAYSGIKNIQLIAQNSIFCADTVIKTVSVTYKPKADFEFSSIFPEDEDNVFALSPIRFSDRSLVTSSAELSGYGLQQRIWNWGNGSNPTRTSLALDTALVYPESRIYFVSLKVKNSEVCTDSITKKLDLTAFISDFPNAFSPNKKGDPLNEKFIPYMNGIKKLETFKVFNRYGEIVYETTNPRLGWDGTFNGQEQPSGTYIYHIKAQTGYNEVIEKNGKVLLIR